MVRTFAEAAVGIFTKDAAVIEAGAGMTRFLSLFYILIVIREVLLSYLRGYGRSRMPMILSLIGMVGLRQLYLAVATAGDPSSLKIVLASLPLGWAAATVLLLLYTAVVIRKMWRDAEEEGLPEEEMPPEAEAGAGEPAEEA